SPRRPAGDPAEAFLTRDVEQAARARSSPTGRRTTRFVGSSTQNRRPGPHELRRHAVATGNGARGRGPGACRGRARLPGYGHRPGAWSRWRPTPAGILAPGDVRTPTAS